MSLGMEFAAALAFSFFSVGVGVIFFIIMTIIFHNNLNENNATVQVILMFVGQILFAIAMFSKGGKITPRFCFFILLFSFIADVIIVAWDTKKEKPQHQESPKHHKEKQKKQ